MVVMCLIERRKLENIADVFWFNIFSLSKCLFIALCGCLGTYWLLVCEVFETVSAYGTVGLSLGIPTVRISCPSLSHGLTLIGKLFFLRSALRWFKGLVVCCYDQGSA